MISFPRIMGHRGAAALAPENTLAAFRRAAAAGATWVEMDVRLAADGPVVVHDATLERTTDGRGMVRQATVASIRALDAGGGEAVPTLAEALAEAHNLGLGLNVELKADEAEPADLVDAVVRCVTDMWRGAPDGLLFSGFSRAVVRALREAAPDIPRGLIAGRLPDDWQAVAAELCCVSIHLGWRDLTAAQVAAVRAAGYAVPVWTVNDRVLAERLRSWGADTIITDRPDLMQGLD